jgi:hypothetical protein
MANYEHIPSIFLHPLQNGTTDKLSEFCGLAENIDLEKVPLFLFDSPIDSLSRRQWLHEQLEQLDDTTLHALFPAFERLLKP